MHDFYLKSGKRILKSLLLATRMQENQAWFEVNK